MNVIVWQAYGTVSVYAAESAAEITGVLAQVQAATASWCIDAHFYTMANTVKRFVDAQAPARARRELVNFVKK